MYAPVFELCRSLSLPVVALGAPAGDLRTAAEKGFDAPDASAWARLSLPEGPEPLKSFSSTVAYQQYARDVLVPDFERFAKFKHAAPFFETPVAAPPAAARRGPVAAAAAATPVSSAGDTNGDFVNFFNSRLLWDASMAARAANWIDESPRDDATLIALVGAEHASYGCGASAHCATRMPHRAAKTVLVQPQAPIGHGRVQAARQDVARLRLPQLVLDEAASFHQLALA